MKNRPNLVGFFLLVNTYEINSDSLMGLSIDNFDFNAHFYDFMIDKMIFYD